MVDMKKSITLMMFSLLVLANNAYSQSNLEKAKVWGVEADLIQPFLPEIGIIKLNVLRRVTSQEIKMKGDILVGMYLRSNVKHDVVEKINEYMLTVGYRQYFWKELHLESKVNVGYAWGTRNLIDGKNYETTTLFWESNLGYKIDLMSNKKSRLYLLPQFGYLANAQSPKRDNIGPRGGKPDAFIQGHLMLGINF